MLVPIVAALLQVLKRIPQIEKIKNLMPFVGIAVSIVICYASKVVNPTVTGIIVGLVASGGYDLIKGLSPSTK